MIGNGRSRSQGESMKNGQLAKRSIVVTSQLRVRREKASALPNLVRQARPYIYFLGFEMANGNDAIRYLP